MLTPFQLRARRALSESPFFGPSADQWIRWIHRTSLRAGETLFQKGEPSDELYGVVSGQIKLCSNGTDGREIHFGLIGAGELVGEIGIRSGAPRHTHAIAMTHCELATIRRRELGLLLDSHPALHHALDEASSEMTKRLSQRTEDNSLLGLEARVEKTLFDIARRFGERIENRNASPGLPQRRAAERARLRRKIVREALATSIVHDAAPHRRLPADD